MVKFPLIDLAYGKYITILIDNKESPSNLSRRTVAKVKARNQLGKPDILTDLSEEAIQYIPPKHPSMPKTGVFVLFAAAGGISVVGNEINAIKGAVFEKMTQALTNADAAAVSKDISDKMQIRSVQEQMSEQLQVVKDVRDTQSFYPPFNTDYRKKADELLDSK